MCVQGEINPPICNVCGGKAVVVVYVGKDMRLDERRTWYVYAPRRVELSWVCGGTHKNQYCRWADGLRRPQEFHGWNYLGDFPKSAACRVDDFLLSHQLHDWLNTPVTYSLIAANEFQEYVEEWLTQEEK